MNEVIWLAQARKYLWLHETAGPQHHPQILKFLDEADGKTGDGKTLGGIRDDETPWCATFISAVLEECKIVSARSAWARSYLNYGMILKDAALGAIAVFERGPRSGHVAFVVGRDQNNRVLVIGGNQGDRVSIAAMPLSRIIGWRWPLGFEMPSPIGFEKLPVGSAAVSTREN